MTRGTLRQLTLTAALTALGTLAPSLAAATSSGGVWTPISPDIQSYGVAHWGVDNYFTVFRDAEDGGGDFPTDAGLTLGILPFEKFRMEIGVDVIEPSDDSVYFNAKAGFPEGALFGSAPALQLGLANAGTASGVNDYDVFYLVIGKTIPHLGRLSVAPYQSNADLLVVSLLVGAVWFNEEAINGEWKMTIQLDINQRLEP